MEVSITARACRAKLPSKGCPSYFVNDTDRLRRFEQDARAAAAESPNIVAVYQLGLYEGAPYVSGAVAVREVDHRQDFFAFGAVLYEILSVKRAFQKPTLADTMNTILNEQSPQLTASANSVGITTACASLP